MPEKVLLNAREVSERVGLHVSTIYARMKRGDFPLALAIGPGTARWYDHEITEWLESRPRYGDPEWLESRPGKDKDRQAPVIPLKRMENARE